jgi:hypothetical protein
MAAAHITITPGFGTGSRVEIDGHDITNAVRGLTIHGEAGSLADITLDLLILDVTEMQDEHARIFIPEETRAALLALGWTPPPDEPAM